MAEPSAEYVCPRCAAVSHNPTDQAEGYCGRCHDWTGTSAMPSAEYVAVCQKALEAIAPCVVGWLEGQMPEWAEKLNAVVPDLQRVLGITSRMGRDGIQNPHD